MQMILYRRALDDATTVVGDVRVGDLARPSPCAGWDVRALLEHMIGQNHGFAEALEHAGSTDAPPTAFAPRPAADDDVAGAWRGSADRVAAAFGTAAPDAEVLLAEVSTQQRIPVAVVLGMHLLDTVVHTWDVAIGLGHPYRPDDELVAAVAAVAPLVADGPTRELAGSSFAPVVAAAPGADDWTATLAWLGRADAGAQRGSS